MTNNNAVGSSILQGVFIAVLLTVFGLAACGSGGESVVNGSVTPDTNTCSTVTYDAPSGAANNIVFTFDKPYVCGQFANGDWWVSEDSGGYVTITSITPTAGAGHNGFEVNPSVTNRQAFESTAEVPYDASLMPSLPLQLSGVSSVVKAVSLLTHGRPQLQFAAVLTIVDAPVNNSAEVFRPAYFGSTKAYYNTSAIRVADIPKYNAASLSSVAGFTIASIASRYRHVQLDHYNSWQGRDMHPADNMPDYGATIATNSAVSLLRLLLDDFNYSNSGHKQALVNYLQMAIDLKAMAIGGNIWDANGGHSNGRKLPLVFAAWAFNDNAFSSAVATSVFSEDKQVWRSPVTGLALFGDAGVSDYAYWQTTVTSGVTGSRTLRDPYGYVDGGGYELGNGYQFCCTAKPWKYTVLALYMLGLESTWSNDPVLIDYVERWVSFGAKALPDPCAPYDGNPANYGFTYGPDSSKPGQCIAGAGRWPASDGINVDAGYYSNSFGDELWAWKKANP